MPFHLYDGDNLLLTVPLVTIGMGGMAAYLSGRAIAQTWRPFWQVPLYMLALAAVVRFFHFALFGEPFLSLPSYAVDFATAFAASALGPGATVKTIGRLSRPIAASADSSAQEGIGGSRRGVPAIQAADPSRRSRW